MKLRHGSQLSVSNDQALFRKWDWLILTAGLGNGLHFITGGLRSSHTPAPLGLLTLDELWFVDPYRIRDCWRQRDFVFKSFRIRFKCGLQGVSGFKDSEILQHMRNAFLAI